MTLTIGIMSGTSVDAIDAALLAVDTDVPPVLKGTASRPFPVDIQRVILSLMTPGGNEIEQSGRLHAKLGELYADVASELVQRAAPKPVSVIGCHGQTIRHRPDGPYPFTLQLGSGAVIANRTGIPAVTDFRSADMASGGQGAPFAPFFHRVVFSGSVGCRAIINLGGIANITLLPGEQSQPVIGFDTGPANCLMDGWVQRHLGEPFDESGNWANQGSYHPLLLEHMLADPYFAKPPPKSTGREYFTPEWLEKALWQCGVTVAPEDVQATLAMLVARTISDQLPAAVTEIYLCGGGTANLHLGKLIEKVSGLPVCDTSILGFPPQWIEAAAFGWMAWATLNRYPSTLPSVTGARHPTIAGAIYFP